MNCEMRLDSSCPNTNLFRNCAAISPEGKLRAYAMKLQALISRLLGFLSLRNAQTIEPTTALTAISFPSGNTRYSFSQLGELRRDLQPRLEANIGEASPQ